PGKTIPKATNQIIYRILIFYIGALAVLMSLYPWNLMEEGSSPFMMIFHSLDATLVATQLNVAVLTAALSVYNSCVYCNSRMLYGLALQGNAPRALTRVNRRGVPAAALGVSAAATAAVVVVNYLMPEGAFGMLMLLVVAALVINWTMISITHIVSRRRMAAAGRKPAFPSPGAPVTNVLCLLFLAGILVVMWFTPGIRTAILLMPLWLVVLSAMYWLRRRQGGGTAAAAP